MKRSRSISSLAMVLGAALLPSVAAHAALVAATLPTSRSVQVGATATVFATVINPEAVAATGCAIAPASALAGTFFYQTTDPATNALIGTANTPVTIAAGAAQSFLLGITLTASRAPEELILEFSCDNVDAALPITGINTVLLSASTTPVPDIIAIALTPSGDGILNVPGDEAFGFFSMASVNVGSAADIRVSARAHHNQSAIGSLLICATNPANGACLAPPAAFVDLPMAANATPTFAVFASSGPRYGLDPANTRAIVEFRDTTDALRGSTSVAFAGGGIAPLFVQAGGAFTLPAGKATDQLVWVLEQLAQPSTSIADINAHFHPSTLATTTATQWQATFDTLRATWANAIVIDLVGTTPVTVTAVIRSPTAGSQQGFLNLSVNYAGNALIRNLSVQNFGGNVQFVSDRTLTMSQAADKFGTLAPETSLLVASVSGTDCTPIATRSNAPRATGSIFKTWVLAALAEAVNRGDISTATNVTLVASEVVPGATLSSEPLGTVFPLQDMATLMMGISDNTATDHLHQLVGRANVETVVTAYGNQNAHLLTPFLSINENFHLLRSFPLADALQFVNGTEAAQVTFLNDRIVPLGALTSFPFFNTEILISGTWQAAPTDVCRAFAHLRALPKYTEGFRLANRALGSQAAQPGVRTRWDRVWYKGGSLATAAGLHVLGHAWLVESDAKGAFVVVALANNSSGGVIDQFNVQSVTSRILQLVVES